MNSNTKINHKIIFFIIIQFHIDILICLNCQSGNSLENSECFNNILIINGSPYRAGHFAKKKMVIFLSNILLLRKDYFMVYIKMGNIVLKMKIILKKKI